MKEKYKNLSGTSVVFAYVIGDDYIAIEFIDGAAYLYDYKSGGRINIEEMKSLSKQGKGLATFINKTKIKYARILKSPEKDKN